MNRETEQRQRYILHADLDAFFASVEQRDNPTLQGQPVVVGGPPESRGVVAAASYEARKYGIKSAMPMITALRRCPMLVRISPRFEAYKHVSRQVMDIFKLLTPLVEPLSLDEAYLDITDQAATETAQTVAENLRVKVKSLTQLTISIGGGPSKTVAKIASQITKPNGLLLIHSHAVSHFLSPLSIKLLSGIGPKSAIILESYGVKTLKDLAESDDSWLVKTLGKRGIELKLRAGGFDRFPVQTTRPTKSISSEETMPFDVEDHSILNSKIERLAVEVSDRLKLSSLEGKTISLKCRLDDFTTFTRQITLIQTTNDPIKILGAARLLLSKELEPGIKFRLLGLTVSNFGYQPQLSLFE